MEDDGSSSDANCSDDFSNGESRSEGIIASGSSGSHNGDEDEDLEQKIKFFFQRKDQ